MRFSTTFIVAIALLPFWGSLAHPLNDRLNSSPLVRRTDPGATVKIKDSAGKEHTATKLSAAVQGNNGYVYRIEGDWGGKPAVAKTGKDTSKDLTEIGDKYKDADQLIEMVKDESGRHWLILHDVGPPANDELLKILQNQFPKERPPACMALIKKATDALYKELEARATQSKPLRHNEFTSQNVFFSKDLSKAFLVDWDGAAREKADDAWLKQVKTNLENWYVKDRKLTAECTKKSRVNAPK